MGFPVSNQVTLLTVVSILMTLSISGAAQPYRNVSLNSFLVADDSNSTWRSPSGVFAFGFRQVSPGGYLLAIMFDEIPERTIIWSANRNDLVERGSRVQLSADEGLVLQSPTGQQIWASSLVGPGVAYGAVLDTGNFVLAAGNNSGVAWQSFDEPTDTLLPGQILNQNGSLFASFSETNNSRGRFKLVVGIDGNLLLYTVNYPMEDNVDPYWSSNTPSTGFRLFFNQSGYVYLSASNGTIVYSLFSNQVSSRQTYQRLTFEYDGVLRHYVHPRSATSTEGRPMSWSISGFEPPNICTVTNRPTSGGACGFNSVCSLNDEQRPVCSCPKGYSIVDPTDRMGGCKPDFVQQSCDMNSPDVENFDFNDIAGVDWRGLEYDYFESVSEEWCRQNCRVDCLCGAAVFRLGECWKKGSPLRNGRSSSDWPGKAMMKIRVRNNNDTGSTNPFDSNKSSKNKSALIITAFVLLGGSVLLNLVMLFAHRFKGKKTNMNRYSLLLPVGVNIRSFTFKELREATNEFKEELGSGACSKVYKGVLKDSNGRIVAVKKLDKIEEEAEVEFKAEVNSISMTNHRNLVRLLGYCDEGKNKLLVYEYMKNGSLADLLFEKSSIKPKPNWHLRVQIAFSIARGLCYLHEECSTQIIHCDIKPQNVLLDEGNMAKISDFGLAKLLKHDQTKTTTAIRGTRGYVAPEWFRNMPITSKVDIYSFGILLLELLCCRKSYLKDSEDESNMILADWAYDCYKKGTLGALVADDQEALGEIMQFEKFVITSIWCVQEDPTMRPPMKRVLQMLEGSVEVPAAPNPASFIN